MDCQPRLASRSHAHTRRSSRFWATAPACTPSKGCGQPAQLALSITFIIVKNERYEALLEFGRHFGLQRKTIGTSLPNIDFCALANGQGVKAISVNRHGALDEALCSVFATTAEPTLVEVAARRPDAIRGCSRKSRSGKTNRLL
jgi:thiamine pyrophosphate-dependent acetolactate synthase large subunit-like protein